MFSKIVGSLVTGAVLFSIAASPQTASLDSASAARSKIISSADLETDLAIVRKAYEELHPGLYRYNSKAEMDSKFAALQKEFRRDRTLAEAYVLFSRFAAQIRCGHTYPNFFNQKKSVAEALFQGQDRVPFYFRWLDDRMVVTEDLTPEHLFPRGTEVFSINGNATKHILKRLMTIARADGANDAKRKSYLGVTGDSEYEAFDIYFPLFFPAGTTSMTLAVKRPGDAKRRNIVTTALTFSQRNAPIKAREAGRKGGDRILFEWRFLEDGNALLRMPTWALYDSKWDWKAWLNARLDELAEKNPHALIIDLRGNEGGEDIGDEILKRITPQDLTISSYRRLVRYRETAPELDPFLDTWDPGFKKWGDAARDLPEPWPTAPPVRYFTLTRDGGDASGSDVIRAAGKPFHGKVFVIVDSSNSSATFRFARLVKEKKLGTLIGEPTGGSLRGINGGAFFFLRLPKSGIELDLPLIGTFSESPQPDSGLSPDIFVAPSVADIVAGRDSALNKIAALVQINPAH